MKNKQKERAKCGRPRIETQLPEWFNLKNYEEAKHLTTAGWYEQLYCRMTIIALIRVTPTYTSQECITEAKKAISLVWENPITNVTGNELLKKYFYAASHWPIAALKENNPLVCLGIHMGKPTYDTHLTIQVDLDLADKILINNFRIFLDTLREQTNTQKLGKNRRAMQASDFIKLAVLPYLDLEAWAAETGAIMTDQIIADAIFPAGERTEDDVQTTRKRAFNLLQPHNLKNLAAQAAAEMLSKK